MTASRPMAPRGRVLLFLGLLALAGTVRPGAARAGDDVEAAEAALAKGDVRAALDALRRLAAAPGGAEDVRVQAGLGTALLRADDPQGAVAAWSVVVKRRGTDLDRIALAEALLGTARQNLASGPRLSVEVVPYLRDALDQLGALKDPASVGPRRAAVEGEVRWLLGDPAAARRALSDAALSKDPQAQDLLARACYQLQDYAAAADAWTAAGNVRGAASAWAAAKDPRGVAAYVSLLRATPKDTTLLDEAVQAALFAGSVAALDQALGGAGAEAATPAEKAGWLRARGRLAEKAGRAADAVARYREAWSTAGAGSDELRTELGRALLSSSDTDPAVSAEAAALFEQTLATHPADEWARQGIDWLARRDAAAAPREWPDRTRLDRAVHLFRLLAETDATESLGWAQLGNMLRQAGDADGAVAAFRKALALNAYDASTWNDLGIALVARGDAAAARDAFQKSIEISPGDTAPRQNAGRLCWLEGDDDGAERNWAAALSGARAVGGHASLFRFLLDRSWRSRVRPDVR